MYRRASRCFHVPAHHFFRITSIEGPPVGDPNLWAASDMDERFIQAKPAHYTAHICLPVTGYGPAAFSPNGYHYHDTLDWYGWDDDGASVHDVIAPMRPLYSQAFGAS